MLVTSIFSFCLTFCPLSNTEVMILATFVCCKCFNPFPHNDNFWRPWKQAFWKHCEKRRNYEQFLLFPQCFLTIWTTFCYFRQIWNCRLQTLSVWKSLNFVSGNGLNLVNPKVCNCQGLTLTLSQTSPGFYVYAVQVFWKHSGKRRNCS